MKFEQEAPNCTMRNQLMRKNLEIQTPPPGLGPAPKKSEWWAVDGEMHEIGDGVPHRERFAIPRDNLPNRRRKQMREQFMRRTRLVLKDSVSHCVSSRSSPAAPAHPDSPHACFPALVL
jgi:hypothetical protein